MKLAESILTMCEKLAKKDVDNFVSFLSKQVDFDLNPHVDLKNSKRDYITIDTGAIPDGIERRLKSLVGSYGGKIFRISDNGGLGHAFHLLDKEKIKNVDESSEFKLLASSSTLEGIKDMIGKYWYSKNIELKQSPDGSYQVYNNGKLIEGFRVISKRGRFRFEGR